MDQLVVLQEIYESFSKGGDGLQKISSKAIEGSCPELTAKLLKAPRMARSMRISVASFPAALRISTRSSGWAISVAAPDYIPLP